jgi:putative heme-binding domain-containing protein
MLPPKGWNFLSTCTSNRGVKLHWPLASVSRVLVTLMGCGILTLPTRVHARSLPDDVRIKLEALNRLKGTDLRSNPALEAVVIKIVGQTRGEPEFVGLVKDFQLEGQEAALADFVRTRPADPASVEALHLLLASTNRASLTDLLTPSVTNRTTILKALGDTADHRITPLIQPVVLSDQEPSEVRTAGVLALARVREGAQALLEWVTTGKLSGAVRDSAGDALRAARWPEIRSAAVAAFPTRNVPPEHHLPSIAELVRQKGDVARGAVVFRRPDIGCIQCHQVNGEGINFGPALSEIGSKLGKDALCVAILEPSAGISFGYEAWNFVLKGDDEVLGLIASETEEEVAIKVPGGVVNRYKKSQIARREKQALSIMPSGLEANMSTQDFVDLIEYLASLKKAH